MIGCMLLLMPLACAQGKSQLISMQLNQIHEILIVFNEKSNTTKISKIITHDIMIH
jgi:hypothetical protein